MSKKDRSRFLLDLYASSSDEDAAFQQPEVKLPQKNHVLNLKGIKRNWVRANRNVPMIQKYYIKMEGVKNSNRRRSYTKNVTKTIRQSSVRTAVKTDVPPVVSAETNGDNETESESSVDADDDDDDDDSSSGSDSATSILEQRRKALSKKSNMLKVKCDEMKIKPILKTKRTNEKKVYTPTRSYDLRNGSPMQSYNLRKRSPKTYLAGQDSSDEEIKKAKKVVRGRRSGGPRMVRSSSPKLVGDISADRLANIALSFKDKIYDISIGTSCHQCRQKTLDTKTVCRGANCYGIQGQFCGPCLWNRYGESVAEALHDCEWTCPACRGICNCSICRNKNGKVATGQLVTVAAKSGFSNVAEYLDHKETDTN